MSEAQWQLRRHAAEAERLIQQFTPAYDVDPEKALDANGRPILLEMRLRLAEIYAAILRLERPHG